MNMSSLRLDQELANILRGQNLTLITGDDPVETNLTRSDFEVDQVDDHADEPFDNMV